MYDQALALILNNLELILGAISIIFSITSAFLMAYIEWKPEDVRRGSVIESGATRKEIQEAINKMGKPFKRDKWYITRGLMCLVVSSILQALALVMK